MYCLGVWYAGSTAEDWKAVQTAQKIISPLTSREHIATSCCLRRTKAITGDPSHPAYPLFDLLPSGRRYRSTKSHTSRLTDSFFPWAIQTTNTNRYTQHVTWVYEFELLKQFALCHHRHITVINRVWPFYFIFSYAANSCLWKRQEVLIYCIFPSFTFKTHVCSNIVVSTAKLLMVHVKVILYLIFMHELFPCTPQYSQPDVSLLSFLSVGQHSLSMLFSHRGHNTEPLTSWVVLHMTTNLMFKINTGTSVTLDLSQGVSAFCYPNKYSYQQ